MSENKGWKFLDPTGATEYKGERTVYPLPGPDEKWGPWFEHPDPVDPDGKDCGPGRFHVMRKLDARYASDNWWPWFAEWDGEIGASYEKVGVRRLRLRRVAPRLLHRYMRLTNLRGADLRRANLWRADLRGANLRRANLRGADLQEALHTNQPEITAALAAAQEERE